MATHDQTWVKVNAPVDSGVAHVVSILSEFDGLQTLQSCQGDPGQRDGYVYFCCGSWQDSCRLVFDRIGPKLKQIAGDDAELTLEATGNDPMAKLSFRAEAADTVVSALKEALRR
jgi:hypothetical protein